MLLVFLFVIENSHGCVQKIKAVAMIPYVLTDAESTLCEEFDDMEMRKYVLILCNGENEHLHMKTNNLLCESADENLRCY